MGGLMTGETPGTMLVLLSSFLFMALGAWAAARWLHGRRLAEMTGPRGAAWRDFRLVAGIVLAANALPVALALASGELVRSLDPVLWAVLLLPAIPLIALQTGAEELLFRGYLQGQLAARFRSPAIWALMPSLAFGAAHWDGSHGGAAWAIVAATALFGLVAADLTALTGRLGAAWGLHFANNLVALTVIGTQGALPGLALWHTPWTLAEAPAAPFLIALDMAILAGIWGAIRVVLKRRLQRAGAANTSVPSASGAPR
jgi:membrane protease YdiL (CAAX protease family)